MNHHNQQKPEKADGNTQNNRQANIEYYKKSFIIVLNDPVNDVFHGYEIFGKNINML